MPQSNISLSYGINRTPSVGHDGELSECVNLIPRAGELVNIDPPTAIGESVPAGAVLRCVHHVREGAQEKDLYIYTTSDGLYYIIPDSEEDIWFTNEAITQVHPIGNILVVTTATAIRFFLWSNNAYQDLGDADFNLDLQFGIKSYEREKSDSRSDAVTISESSSGDLQDLELLVDASPSTTDPQSRIAIYDPTASFDEGDVYLVVSSTTASLNSGYYIRVQFVGNLTPVGGTDPEQKTEEIAALYGETQFSFEVPPVPAGYTGTWTEMQVSWSDIHGVRAGFSSLKIYKVVAGTQPTGTVSQVIIRGGDCIIGLANDLMVSATKDNMFMMPFFVRTAIRLTTGQIINISAPCFIEPNTLYAPSALLRERQVDGVYTYASVSVRAFVSELYYRLVGAVNLTQLRDVVQSVVVAVTPPVYLYDQSVSEEDLKLKTVIIDGFTPNVDDSWGESPNRSLTYEGVLSGAIPTNNKLALLPTGGKKEGSAGAYYDTAIRDRRASALSTWYIIKEIPITGLKESAGWVKLSLDPGTLSTLYGLSTGDLTLLTDTAVSTYKLVSTNGLFSYNNRLFYIGGTEQRFLGWNPIRMSGFVGTWQDYGSGAGQDSRTFDVTIIDEHRHGVTSTWPRNGRDTSKLRFIAHSDASVESAYFNTDFGCRLWTFAPQGTAELAISFIDSASNVCGTTYGEDTGILTAHPNRLYMSYLNQPLALDRTTTLTFTGTIRALAVATQALTQGQFGQFPIYVFTSDGIWMLTVSDTGAVSSSQPVSRDVITAGTQPLQTDNAVIFITAQGLKLIEGSQTVLLSEPVAGFNPDDTQYRIANRSGYDDLNALLAASDTQDFVTQLQTARLLYDYTYGLIHIYIGLTKHYVYSLSTRQWSTQYLKIGDIAATVPTGFPVGSTTSTPLQDPTAIVPAYPLSILQYGTALYHYDRLSSFTALRPGVALTRPIAFDDPTSMKALMDFRIIGQRTNQNTFRRMAIYVSNDGYRWHQLQSLKRGSYKYYRFLILSRMTDHDTLTGITLQYQPRRTNKLR